jgi:hypothetical protein
MRQSLPADQPLTRVSELTPIELDFPPAAHGLKNAGLRIARSIATHVRHQEMFFLIARLYGRPLALLQFFRMDTVHLEKNNGFFRVTPHQTDQKKPAAQRRKNNTGSSQLPESSSSSQVFSFDLSTWCH